jgi:hypothetical protein
MARQKHQRGWAWWKKADYLMAARSQRERKSPGTKYPFKIMPSVTYSLLPRPMS